MLGECKLLLLTVVLQGNVDEVWTWLPDSRVGYTVRGAYRTLTRGMPLNPNAPLVYADLLWMKDVPLKVSVFA